MFNQDIRHKVLDLLLDKPRLNMRFKLSPNFFINRYN